jgi:hypothetical protein
MTQLNPPLNHEKPTSQFPWKWIVILILGFMIIRACSNNTSEPVVPDAPTESNTTKTVYNFTLTECLGKDLNKAATFTVDTKSTNWILDFNNGESIIYTIQSGNSSDPMCGLKAKDSFGVLCTICIRPNGGEVKINFDYSGKQLVYSGYHQK